jgi:Cu+-exporting ATPase
VETAHPVRWKKLDEIKGLGIRATATNGDIYEAGSRKMVKHPGIEDHHHIYVIRNNECIAWIDLSEQIRPEAAAVVQYFKSKNIKTILLSGDLEKNCRKIASSLQMDEVIAEQSPEQKMAWISKLSAESTTAMVGDGINDAPALAKASIGISMSEASQIAMQTADLVLVNQGLANLPLSMELGRHTFNTIRQNLFWAFFYNIIAIPLAAFGLLTPAIAAFSMGFSDVLLVGNSIRLYFRKLSN